MSGFTIPNTPDSLNQNQAEPDSLDFQILGNQKSGVVSGMLVAPGSAAQTVTVSSGEVLINGAYYPYAGGTVQLTAYTSPTFFDIIHARLSGSTVTCYAVRPNTGGTNPRFPSSGSGANEVNLDSTDVVLAAVWRVDSGIPVAQAITDKRIFVRSSTVRTLTDTVSANRGSAGDTYVNTAWTPNSTTASPFSVKVGSTWYNLSYWTANSNISTTGTITANGGFVGNASSASSMPYSGLTGTVPTWNQNTTGKANTAGVADSANAVTWANVSGKPSIGDVFNNGGTYSINISGTAAAASAVTWANVSGKPAIAYNDGGTYSINVTGSAGRLVSSNQNNSINTTGLGAYNYVEPLSIKMNAHSGAHALVYRDESDTFRFYVTDQGNIGYIGSPINLSDVTTKEDIYEAEVLQLANAIDGLTPKYFKYINGNDENNLGFIAQDVLEVLPDAVVNFDKDLLALKMDVITVALVAKCQELERRLALLEAQ